MLACAVRVLGQLLPLEFPENTTQGAETVRDVLLTGTQRRIAEDAASLRSICRWPRFPGANGWVLTVRTLASRSGMLCICVEADEANAPEEGLINAKETPGTQSSDGC